MWDPWADAHASEQLHGRLKWFLLGRVAIISGFLGMVALLYLRSGREEYVVSVHWLLVAIVITYAFSIVSALLLSRAKRLEVFTHVQVTFDIVLITGVLYLTGGVHSPFGFLYSLPIINGAVLLFAGGAFIGAFFATVLYDGLMLGLAAGFVSAASHVLPPAQLDVHLGLRLVSMNLTFFLIAYLAGILTHRLHAMERLLEERQAERDRLSLLQETLARTIGSGLITTDPDGTVTSIDQTAEELSGCLQAGVVGQDIGAVFPPLRLTPTARLRFLQSTCALEPIEFSHEMHDGQEYLLRCVAAPVRDTYGHPIGVLYVLQNVTRLKEIEQESVSGADLAALCQEDLGEAVEIAGVTDGLYGVSQSIRQIRETIDRVAGSDATVLITGESGTGKEVAARALHACSARRDKAFIAINCGAIPEHLIESELFGHVRGAFTGAVADRPGCFRVADGGSVFLDEIGELPLHLQVKMLRILQERVFRPVGSETSVAVNIRIIAASNRDLLTLVRAGEFREDLFYRLNVITIHLPPLRERRDDIPLLVRQFLRHFAELHGRRMSRFSVAAGRVLLQHQYPGNVRELENIVEHAVALCDDDTATEEHLPAYLFNGSPQEGEAAPPPEFHSSPPRVASGPAPWGGGTVDLDRDLAEYEKAILLRALAQTGGVKKRAAELLGINYRSLRHRLQKYGLSDLSDVHTTVQ